MNSISQFGLILRARSDKLLGNLGKRAAKGSALTFVGYGIGNIIRLASNLILTRLLAPEAFGIMAVTTTILAWLNMLSDFGIKPSVVRSEHGEDPNFLGTALTIQFARSLSLGIMLILVSFCLPFANSLGWFHASSVYADARLPHFLQFIALGCLVGGLASMKIFLKERDLRMRPIIQLEILTQLLTIAAIIALALMGAEAYSLVIGSALGLVAHTIGSYLLVDGPKVGFAFDRRFFNEILSYGKWLVIASFFGFLTNRGGQLMLGYFVEQEPFSLYAIGTIWVMTARTLLQQMMQKVGYPVFAEVSRERPEDRTRIYYRVRAAVDAVSIALFLAAYFLSEPFFDVLYSDEYHDVAKYVRLAAVGLLLLPYNLLSTVLLAYGDSKRFAVVTVVPGLVLTIGLPFVFRGVGFEGAIVFVALVPMASLPFIWNYSKRVVQLRPGREALSVVLAILAGIVTVASYEF